MDNLYFISEYQLSKQCLRCFDIRNNLVAVGSHSEEIFIFEISDEKFGKVQKINFFQSKDDRIAIGCQDKRVYIIDIYGNPVQILEGNNGIISCIKETNINLITGSWDGTLKVWQKSNFQLIKAIDGFQYAVVCEVLKNGKIVAGSSDGVLQVFNENFERIFQQKIHNQIIRDLKEY